MLRISITGTDTLVGKTVVACALAAELADRGVSVRVFKPIETGVDADSEDRDAEQLRRASRSAQSLAEVGPVVFGTPVAPLVAAHLEGTAVDIDALDRAFEAAAREGDALIVEGAGGLLVPIAPGQTFATLFARWRLPVAIVAPNRLGAINHVMLTVSAARAAGLLVAGVVVNDRRPAEVADDRSVTSNEDVLRELLAPVPIVRFPWIDDTSSTAELVRAARESGLASLLQVDTALSRPTAAI